LSHSLSGFVATDAPADAPGWSLAPSNAVDAGFTARGSWLLEPDTGTGMLLYPRDWTFVERRDVTTHLRAHGWSVVPISRFLHLTSDGTTAIRLLSRFDAAAEVTSISAEVLPMHWGEHAPAAPGEVLEASV
jgi:hypothetical protein